jgi:hypothetical protein
MKNFLYSITAVALFLAATLTAKPLDITFTANNNYEGPVGIITINTASGPSYLDVTGSGQFNISIPSATTGLVINSYIIFAGVDGTATLPNSDKVKVTWSSPSIIVIDTEENN